MYQEPLKFKVAPHVVEDLGFSLYTSLPKVLVEFVANAYDADSPFAKVKLNREAIEQKRKEIKAEWETECIKAEATGAEVLSLEQRTLPEEVCIVIEDAGHGMSRNDLQEKFLFAGRRRRDADNSLRSKNKRRLLMGRKGLGKLAGFGVAHKIVIETRAKENGSALRITLDYDKVREARQMDEIPIEEEVLEDGGSFEISGTRVILTRLLYEPMKSRMDTIRHQVGDHFALIESDDFRIELNEEIVEPTQRNLVYAWPNPELAVGDLVEKKLEREAGADVYFKYRIRFTEDRAALSAQERGIRVYTHKRLASAPSLMDADTNMHGFRMTDYLDGVVHADFIDDQPVDYIATDRQTLRWESPLLHPMYEFLSDEIKAACKARQAARDKEKQDKAKEDEFTRGAIERAGLTRSQTKAAYRIAGAIAGLHKQGLGDAGYQTQFGEVMRGFGRGEMLTTLANLAAEDHPALDRVVAEVTRLTADELDGFCKVVKGRLDGIAALAKIVEAADFKSRDNEKQIQRLFENCPWLLDPRFSQFLTADVGLRTLFDKLSEELQIGKYAKKKDICSDKRPDLVFLLGSKGLSQVVIVELKSANKPLENVHLEQLEYYLVRAEEWLKENSNSLFRVQGELLGSMPTVGTRAQGQVVLLGKKNTAGPHTPWRIRDYNHVLEDTRAAHEELLESAAKRTSDVEK